MKKNAIKDPTKNSNTHLLQNTQKHNFQFSHPRRGNPIFKQKYTPESQGALVGSLLESENRGGNSAGGVQGRWRREGGDLRF